MRRALLALLAAAALSCVAAPLSHAAVRHDQWPLHMRASATSTCWHCAGPRVGLVQFLIRDPRPAANVFSKVKGTFKGQPTYFFGDRTRLAVKAYKFRLGYPVAGQCGATKSYVRGIAGRYFVALLLGHKQRPLCWVALAQRRLQAIEAGASPMALKIKAFEIAQLGTHEQCGGNCNRGWLRGPGGYSVDDYERSVGLIGQPWCAILQRFSFRKAGAPAFAVGYNANYVPDIGRWAYRHNLLHAKAKVGALVAFLANSSVLSGTHLGYVVKVTASGYVTIEGNSGDAVRERWYAFNDRLRVFIYPPQVA